jgi:hypothetical protein
MQKGPKDGEPKSRPSSMEGGSTLPHSKAASCLALVVLVLVAQCDRSLKAATADKPRGAPKTFVDMTPAELAKVVPELKHLEPAENQDLLPQILQRAGAEVGAFFDSFPNTTCTERVTSMVDSSFGAGAFHRDDKYNYLALAPAGAKKDVGNWSDTEGRLREFRTDDKGELVQPDARQSVVTIGFVSMAVHFHPDYQPDSRFRYLGREAMEKQDTYLVAFAQRPGVARQVARAQFQNQSVTVLLQGVAWIDPATFRILRLRTDIQQPEVNIGLLKETTEVVYSEVSFRQGGKTLWLPREVTVSGHLDKYNFHNQHRYSDYRLFNVEVEEKSDHP